MKCCPSGSVIEALLAKNWQPDVAGLIAPFEMVPSVILPLDSRRGFGGRGFNSLISCTFLQAFQWETKEKGCLGPFSDFFDFVSPPERI